jgi:alkyldihydroxyacetonephosphate synthase
MKPAEDSHWKEVVEKLKKFYVLKLKGYDADNLVACTLLFEGPKKEMEIRHKAVVELAKNFKGMVGGPENGMRGYMLTYLIAYTRDLALTHGVAAESFETSCPWQKVSSLCRRVKARIYDEAAKLGFTSERVWVSFRVTQLYETGAAVYVYFTLYHKGFDTDKVVHYYEIVEDAARDEVLVSGGSLSHHHGVGKIRKGFMERTLPPMALEWQGKIKDAIDPNNVFAINNTVYRSEEERKAISKKF